jgi:hypothetical protein
VPSPSGDSDAIATLGTPARIGASFDVWPRVVPFGSRWLAVWEQNVTHDNPRSSIVGAFVGPDGVSQGRFTVSDSGFDDRPHLAVGVDRALVAWEDGDIFGRRIGNDGTLYDTARGIVVAGAPEKQFRASVAWDGAQWVVAYLDHRNDPYPKQEQGDIYATRVAADGSVLDPSGFAVAAAAVPEETPAVNAPGGAPMFAYASFVAAPPYASLRIAIRSSDPASASEMPGVASGLLMAKDPGGTSLHLTWGPSCRAGVDYAVYEGSVGRGIPMSPIGARRLVSRRPSSTPRTEIAISSSCRTTKPLREATARTRSECSA